jgi:hypothetical protein
MTPRDALCALIVVGSALILGQCVWAVADEKIKIFSLQKSDGESKPAPPELSDPYVYGISWRFKWSALEPREGEFRWDVVDKALATTRQAGKKAMLRVVAGVNSPDWLKSAGAMPFAFRNTDLAHPQNYRDNLSMFVPWDEVYLSKWGALIRALGQRYSGHPEIYSIQMTGGGYIGEMNLPKAIAQWQAVGYTDKKLIAAWQRIIDTYQEAFPQTPTNLDLGEPLGRNHSNVLEPVVSYVLSNYPRKVYLQHNGLKADLPQHHRVRQILRAASRKTLVGYQMVGGKDWLPQQTGDRQLAFRKALEDRASYIEVYASDIRDPEQRSALAMLANAAPGE